MTWYLIIMLYGANYTNNGTAIVVPTNTIQECQAVAQYIKSEFTGNFSGKYICVKGK